MHKQGNSDIYICNILSYFCDQKYIKGHYKLIAQRSNNQSWQQCIYCIVCCLIVWAYAWLKIKRKWYFCRAYNLGKLIKFVLTIHQFYTYSHFRLRYGRTCSKFTKKEWEWLSYKVIMKFFGNNNLSKYMTVKNK